MEVKWQTHVHLNSAKRDKNMRWNKEPIQQTKCAKPYPEEWNKIFISILYKNQLNVKDLSLKHERLKLLEENIGDVFQDSGIWVRTF